MDDADEDFDIIFVVVGDGVSSEGIIEGTIEGIAEGVREIGDSLVAIRFLLGATVSLVGIFVGILVGIFVGILEGLFFLNEVVIVSEGSVGCISKIGRTGKLGLSVIMLNIESVGTRVGGILFIGVGALENTFQEN